MLGFLARLQGTVFVERGNRRAIPIVNAALAERLKQGEDIVVFAEGTSSDGAGVLKFNASHFAMLSELAATDAAAPTLAPAAISIRSEKARSTAAGSTSGWYGDMTFLPHLWSLMKRGGAKCHILWGEAVDPGSGDRKALAAATEAGACARLLRAADVAGREAQSNIAPTRDHAARRGETEISDAASKPSRLARSASAPRHRLGERKPSSNHMAAR